MKNLSSWGNYPSVQNAVLTHHTQDELKAQILKNNNTIAFGNGRSYGDSALSTHALYMKSDHFFIDFDQKTGVLHCESGVLLADILEYFVPRGWFLRVTPGTKLITVGGAIASDVHGKNHHIEGCFSESVQMFHLMLADGNTLACSKTENREFFLATCGGMGLTGVILDAKIQLKRINSQFINQTIIKTSNLKETFEMFENNKEHTYSVAWIDCLAKGKELGKCLLMVGDFRDDGKLDYKPSQKLTIPFNFPSFTLNKWTVKAFNWLYYKKVKEKISQQKVTIDSFFYPLDGIGRWNRIYGKKGFTQYQFILPLEQSFQGLEEILTTISESGKGSFLAVLKLYGKENDNFLSFPMEGYSLALDFKIEKGLFKLLDQLDEIVAKYGGRIYLAKDVRVKKELFEQGYPKIEQFRAIRKKYQLEKKFNSLQSRRVGL